MNSKYFRWTVGLAAIIGMGFSLSACGDGERSSSKLLSGEKKLSGEEERIQKLLKVRVWDETAGDWVERSAAQLAWELPRAYRGKPIIKNGAITTDECVQYNVAADSVSVAINFNKLARSLVPVQIFNNDGSLQYRIPPQEHTARVALF